MIIEAIFQNLQLQKKHMIASRDTVINREPWIIKDK